MKPTVKLLGQDGNAFVIIGLCKKAARKAGWSTKKWQNIQYEMMSSDYDKLLAVVMEHFEVE